MTRRLLSVLSLTLVAGVMLASPASAYEDSTICVGGKEQGRPGSYQGICLERILQLGQDVPVL